MHGDDDDDNPIKHCNDNNDVLEDDNNNSDKVEFGVLKEKQKWGEMKGCSRYALSKRQDFDQNTNSYVNWFIHEYACRWCWIT